MRRRPGGASSANVLETDRLIVRRLNLDDAAFILQLLNDPLWLRFIGDKGVRTLDDACNYLRKGPLAMYECYGFGLFLTVRKDDGAAIGMCGLIKRDALDDVDIGFAFLPEFRAQGYALESASAMLAYGKDVFGLKRIVAIASPDNERSARLLMRLGMKFEKSMMLTADDEVSLYALDF